jgi:hypothetical protein
LPSSPCEQPAQLLPGLWATAAQLNVFSLVSWQIFCTLLQFCVDGWYSFVYQHGRNPNHWHIVITTVSKQWWQLHSVPFIYDDAVDSNVPVTVHWKALSNAEGAPSSTPAD